MIQIRKSEERGGFDFGWLKTKHTFSFGDYYDPRFTHFRSLRVINEDHVAAGQGFPTHSHQDMEIITYILEGSLEHKDSMGNTSRITPGEVQRMTAGTGVTHSEFNALSSGETHLLQIWIFPEKKGLKPGYEQKRMDVSRLENNWCLVASPGAESGAVTLHQDAKVWVTRLDAGKSLEYSIKEGRGAWLQVARGAVSVSGQALKAGDGAALEKERMLTVRADKKSELVLFDLA